MGLLGKNIKFWGAVGVVAGAMKLKDRWDECESIYVAFVGLELTRRRADRQVPNHDPEEALGAGPVALHSPTIESPPPSYMVLDTEIPAITTRPTRKRSKSCCMCCGTKYVALCIARVVWLRCNHQLWAVLEGLWHRVPHYFPLPEFQTRSLGYFRSFSALVIVIVFS